MAHKKAGGSTKNGRDSESKRLGVKKYGREFFSSNAINMFSNAIELPSGEAIRSILIESPSATLYC